MRGAIARAGTSACALSGSGTAAAALRREVFEMRSCAAAVNEKRHTHRPPNSRAQATHSARFHSSTPSSGICRALRSVIVQYSVSTLIARLPNGSIIAASVLLSRSEVSWRESSHPISTMTLPT
jgi:hypothetical protein